MTGEAALTMAGHGSDDAARRLGVLFDAHHERLYRLARRMTRSADDARDLVQETFLRAARAPTAVPVGAASEEAWLVRVLINLCRDRWRQVEARRRLDAIADRQWAIPASDAEARMVAHSVVWQALETLPPRRRAVVVMHELDEIPLRDIARVLGVTQATVRWHLSIGRRHLAWMIRGAGGAGR